MALRISTGSGATLATNVIDGAHYQIISGVSLYPSASYIGLASILGTVNISGGSTFTRWDSGATVAISHMPAVSANINSGATVNILNVVNSIVSVANFPSSQAVTGTFWQATQPISGTVTANLSATDNTVIDAIQAATEATQAAVEGPLTVSSHAVTNAGTFAVQAAQAGTWNVGVNSLISLASGTLVGLNPSANHIGSVSIFGNITTTAGMTTLFPGPNQIGSVTISNIPAVSQSGTWNVGLSAGTNNVGDVDVLTVPALVASSAYIGLASVNIGGTLPALSAGTAAIGKLAANSGVDIGDVDVTSISAGANYIGLASVNIGGTLPALTAGTANIGDVDVLTIAAGDNNIGNVDIVTLPALAAGTNNIGDVDVLTLPAIPTGGNYIGLATVIPAYISNYTSFSTIMSASGTATLFTPPNGQRWNLKDLHISSLGASFVQISSSSNPIIPYTALATTGGFAVYYGTDGLRAKAVDQAFVVQQNSLATISVMANVRFE